MGDLSPRPHAVPAAPLPEFQMRTLRQLAGPHSKGSVLPTSLGPLLKPPPTWLHVPFLARAGAEFPGTGRGFHGPPRLGRHPCHLARHQKRNGWVALNSWDKLRKGPRRPPMPPVRPASPGDLAKTCGSGEFQVHRVVQSWCPAKSRVWRDRGSPACPRTHAESRAVRGRSDLCRLRRDSDSF